MIESSAVSDKKRDIMILQSWFSPAFPIGAFSYSHGLETAIQDGLITDEVSLQSWISTLLSNGSGRNDGIFIKETYNCLLYTSPSPRDG